jgi:hypothetical protein
VHPQVHLTPVSQGASNVDELASGKLPTTILSFGSLFLQHHPSPLSIHPMAKSAVPARTKHYEVSCPSPDPRPRLTHPRSLEDP